MPALSEWLPCCPAGSRAAACVPPLGPLGRRLAPTPACCWPAAAAPLRRLFHPDTRQHLQAQPSPCPLPPAPCSQCAQAARAAERGSQDQRVRFLLQVPIMRCPARTCKLGLPAGTPTRLQQLPRWSAGPRARALVRSFGAWPARCIAVHDDHWAGHPYLQDRPRGGGGARCCGGLEPLPAVPHGAVSGGQGPAAAGAAARAAAARGAAAAAGGARAAAGAGAAAARQHSGRGRPAGPSSSAGAGQWGAGCRCRRDRVAARRGNTTGAQLFTQHVSSAYLPGPPPAVLVCPGGAHNSEAAPAAHIAPDLPCIVPAPPRLQDHRPPATAAQPGASAVDAAAAQPGFGHAPLRRAGPAGCRQPHAAPVAAAGGQACGAHAGTRAGQRSAGGHPAAPAPQARPGPGQRGGTAWWRSCDAALCPNGLGR